MKLKSIPFFGDIENTKASKITGFSLIRYESFK